MLPPKRRRSHSLPFPFRNPARPPPLLPHALPTRLQDRPFPLRPPPRRRLRRRRQLGLRLFLSLLAGRRRAGRHHGGVLPDSRRERLELLQDQEKPVAGSARRRRRFLPLQEGGCEPGSGRSSGGRGMPSEGVEIAPLGLWKCSAEDFAVYFVDD
ncbi:hypothetical protein E2542_SST02541 [Spatholobus suberectus]|nr:hypothetical protein E2542_SST02541 [Spatholobus suberectus]